MTDEKSFKDALEAATDRKNILLNSKLYDEAQELMHEIQELERSLYDE